MKKQLQPSSYLPTPISFIKSLVLKSPWCSLSTKDQQTHFFLSRCWLLFLIKQIIRLCYFIQNRHHTVCRLLCTYFTFSWGTQSLCLFRWGSSQRANNYENMTLSDIRSISPSGFYTKTGGGYRWAPAALRHQGDSKTPSSQNQSHEKNGHGKLSWSQVLRVSWALHHMPTEWPHADFGWGIWNETGSFATVIWVTAQQHVRVNKITCAAAT